LSDKHLIDKLPYFRRIAHRANQRIHQHGLAEEQIIA